MKRDYVSRGLLLLLIGLVISFIFSNSLSAVAQSATASQKVLELVQPMLRWFVGAEYITLRLVRKLAHVVEFGMLGLVLSLPFRGVRCAPFFVILLAALLDETLQIYSGRGPQVQDVWLDFFGGCGGLLLGISILRLLEGIRRCQQDSCTE